MANVIWGSTGKPISSRQLADVMEGLVDIEGTLYVGYPVIGTPEGAFSFDALFLGETLGAVAFDIVEGREIGDYQSRQDDLYNKLRSKLINYPSLMGRRELDVEITTITFAPAVSAQKKDDEYIVCGKEDLADILENIDWTSPTKYPSLCAAIQSITNIRRKSRRKEPPKKINSKGEKLQKINNSIANLDSHQSAAVVETFDGVQRIRGLAGSGKTIVLALKVAYLHAQNPDWKICITFNTRSLKAQFERLINTFVIEQTSEEPDWNRVKIMHSWGSPNSEGIYYEFARRNGESFYDFGGAQRKFGDAAFAGACEEALNAVAKPKELFDVILVDEAQDLPPAFLKLCYLSLRSPKRLVYAYDELQSLTDASLPPPEEIFGHNKDGTAPLVSFQPAKSGEPRQDIILETCYRNPRPILVTAHALGFGIYRKPGGLIQIFDRSELWQDVGYQVVDGELADNKRVRLARNTETSPRFLEQHSDIDDLIQFKCFETDAEQDEWLVKSIIANIEQDDLSPDDVLVINPNPVKTRSAVSSARASLFAQGFNSTLAGVTNSPDVFFESGLITFTGIFRAKGNEAAMVYVINAQDCFESAIPAYLTRARNQLFTAMTRSKAWVRVVGVGQRMAHLIGEFDEVKRQNFSLSFVYPDEAKRKEIHIVNRDMSNREMKRVAKKITDLRDILESIESGELRVEDLPPSIKKRFKNLL